MKMRRTHHIVLFLALFLAAGAVVAAESAQQERKILAGSTAATGTARMYEQPQEAVVLVATATSLPDALTPRDRRMLNRITGYLKHSDTDRAKGSWEKLVRAMSERGTSVDLGALIQWVLRESYLKENKDLAAYAEKVRLQNDVKRKIRRHLEETRAAPPKEMNRAQLTEHIKQWEEKLQSAGDDAQLANIDLQNALQKQQQTLQTMSNVSKMLHDTAMAIIRKIG